MSTRQPTEPVTSGTPPASVIGAPLPRGLTVIVGVIGVVILGTGIRGAAGIVAPTMLSLVLTIAVLPVGTWARRHGWPSWLATLLALVTAYAILLVLLVGTIICLVKLVDLLPQYTKDAQNLTDQLHDWLSGLGLGTETTSDAWPASSPQSSRCGDSGRAWGLAADLEAATRGGAGQVRFDGPSALGSVTGRVNADRNIGRY
jgi:hypothetical protein